MDASQALTVSSSSDWPFYVPLGRETNNGTILWDQLFQGGKVKISCFQRISWASPGGKVGILCSQMISWVLAGGKVEILVYTRGFHGLYQGVKYGFLVYAGDSMGSNQG